MKVSLLSEVLKATHQDNQHNCILLNAYTRYIHELAQSYVHC